MRRPSTFNVVSVALGLAFLYLPITILVIYSFNASRLVGVWGGWSTRWYAVLLQDQALLEARIARLEQRLDAARVAEPDVQNGVVDLGERVRLRNLDTGAKHEYELVGSLEAEPAAGRISAESPVGRALIGRRRGDVALVEAPRGRLRFRIVALDVPAAPA